MEGVTAKGPRERERGGKRRRRVTRGDDRSASLRENWQEGQVSPSAPEVQIAGSEGESERKTDKRFEETRIQCGIAG